MSKYGKFLLFALVLLAFLTAGGAWASENVTADAGLGEKVDSQDLEIPLADKAESTPDTSPQAVADSHQQKDARIAAKDVRTYYKENSQLTAYLKDASGKALSNRKVSISLDNKVYDKVTDGKGKVTLKLNLKPKTYSATISFAGDRDYASSSKKVSVKVSKASMTLKTADFKTHFESGFYFKAKVTNKITKRPLADVRVAFKVYSNSRYKTYYATTNDKGVAQLKKNFRVGSYRVITSVGENAASRKSTLTILPTTETGCTSLYVQVSNYESVAGFRRDSTNARDLHIVKYNLYGKYAVKQYKQSSYFFHMVTTADGWMFATGGADNPTINSAIERLGGIMAKTGKIEHSYLKTIQNYEWQLGIGHFSIKAPNGAYALVWSSGIYYGKLKPGEYISVPNGMSCFRHGTWSKFSTNPVKAAIKIGATDSFGINRRDITAFHWKATTRLGMTTSALSVFVANDNGHLAGLGTGYLMDNVYFKGKFISKYSLPYAPSSKYLGLHKFGGIDRFIKEVTTVKVPKLVKIDKKGKALNIAVKSKKTKKPVENLRLMVKAGKKTFAIRTDSRGVAKFTGKHLKAGTYNVRIYSGNMKYYVGAVSKITIKKSAKSKA